MNGVREGAPDRHQTSIIFAYLRSRLQVKVLSVLLKEYFTYIFSADQVLTQVVVNLKLTSVILRFQCSNDLYFIYGYKLKHRGSIVFPCRPSVASARTLPHALSSRSLYFLYVNNESCFSPTTSKVLHFNQPNICLIERSTQ